MKAPCVNTCDKRAGFSLVEVLVAVAVMAIMLGTAATALKMLSGAAIRGARHSDQMDMLARGLAAVRNDLSRLRPVVGDDARNPAYLFNGTEQSIRFVVIEPNYPGEPGSYIITYTVREAGAETQLIRARDAYRPTGRGRSRMQDESDELVVLQGAYRFAFNYLAQSSEQARWTSKWSDPQKLPVLIELRVTSTAVNAQAIPDLIVRPQIDAEITCVTAERFPCSLRTGRLEAQPAQGQQRWEAVPR